MKKTINYILKILSKSIIDKYRPKIIGITGSVGKTTTKEAVSVVLGDKYDIRASIKNYNNEIGVPLTIIGLKSPGKSVFGWIWVFLYAIKLIIFKDSGYPEMLILEMGADKIGDIGYLTSFVPCDVGVVTNVSESHIEFFGSLKKIQLEKRKIVENLTKDGFAVLNYDVDLVRSMKDNTNAGVTTFGFDADSDIRAIDLSINYNDNNTPSGISFKLKYYGNVVPVFMDESLGYSQVYSALVGVVVGDIFKVNLFDSIKALKKFKTPIGRMRIIDGIKGSFIIDDTYNSSPASAKVALETLGEVSLADKGKKIAVLGDMLELGPQTQERHREIGISVVENGVDILITKGSASRDIARGAIDAGMSKDKIFSFSDNDTAGRFLQEQLNGVDVILVKGSQGMRMEEIVKEVMANPLKAGELLVRQGREWGL